MKKSVHMLALLTLVLLCSTIIVTSRAADYTKIGVKVGYTADYSIEGLSYDRLKLEVTEVTGTFVNITITQYWSNGTIKDVVWGRGNVSRGDLAEVLVCSGLKAGDPMWQGGSYIFNNTLSMEIAGVSRNVNELVRGEERTYFDQSTGIFAKFVEVGGLNYTMISTNMWGPLDMAVLLLIGGGAAVVVVIAVAAALIRKRGK